jgi:hypothetical protein
MEKFQARRISEEMYASLLLASTHNSKLNQIEASPENTVTRKRALSSKETDDMIKGI